MSIFGTKKDISYWKRINTSRADNLGQLADGADIKVEGFITTLQTASSEYDVGESFGICVRIDRVAICHINLNSIKTGLIIASDLDDAKSHEDKVTIGGTYHASTGTIDMTYIKTTYNERLLD